MDKRKLISDTVYNLHKFGYGMLNQSISSAFTNVNLNTIINFVVLNTQITYVHRLFACFDQSVNQNYSTH